jgi:hypothetical protein
LQDQESEHIGPTQLLDHKTNLKNKKIKLQKPTSFDEIAGSQEKFMLISPRTLPVREGLLPPRNTETPAE